MAYRKQNDKNWNNKEIVEKELWTRNAQNNSYAGAPYPIECMLSVCLSLTEMNPFLILETHKCINYTQNQLNPKIQKRPYYNHSYNYNSTMQYIVYSIVANILYSFAVQKSLTLCKHIRVGLNQLFARIAFLEGHYSDRDSLNASSHNRT